MNKDNRTHRLLGALIKCMEKNNYQPTYLSLVTKIHPWYKYPYYKFFDPSFEQVRALFEKIGPNGDKIFMGVVGEFEPTRLSHEDLYRMRNVYKLGDYKEELKPLEIATKTIAIVAPIIIASTAIINTLDNRRAPILTDSLRIEKQRIELLLKKISKDSVTLDSILDLLESSKNSSLKNTLSVDKQTKK